MYRIARQILLDGRGLEMKVLTRSCLGRLGELVKVRWLSGRACDANIKRVIGVLIEIQYHSLLIFDYENN